MRRSLSALAVLAVLGCSSSPHPTMSHGGGAGRSAADLAARAVGGGVVQLDGRAGAGDGAPVVLFGGAGAGAAGAGAPDCSPDHSCAMFVANADGTVTDMHTGLTWLGNNKWTARRWKDAVPFCNSQTANGAPFRVPTIAELQTLLDSHGDPAMIDSHFFPNTDTVNPYWGLSDAVTVVPAHGTCLSACPLGTTACVPPPAPCPAHSALDFATGKVEPVEDLALGDLRCVQ